MAEFVKLSSLVNDQFTVEKVWGYTWKKWDNDQKRMLTADKWAEGYRKIYEVDTDKGKLSLSGSQLGQCLEAIFENGIANLNGKTIAVKSNGKTGMEIRYFFNKAQPSRASSGVSHVGDVVPSGDDILGGEEIDMSDIPL